MADINVMNVCQPNNSSSSDNRCRHDIACVLRSTSIKMTVNKYMAWHGALMQQLTNASTTTTYVSN